MDNNVEVLCKNCKFLDDACCVRYPPTYAPEHKYGQWPMVGDQNIFWCGEFSPKLRSPHD